MIDILHKYHGLLPPREQLWVVVREARNYLHIWVNNPDSRSHPLALSIEFDARSWGSMDIGYESGTFRGCLAGLWYLYKEGRIVGEEYSIPPLAEFLDMVRYPNTQAKYIERVLGVNIPPSREHRNTLVGTTWSPNNPEHILAFLDWLLTQHSIDMEVVVDAD